MKSDPALGPKYRNQAAGRVLKVLGAFLGYGLAEPVFYGPRCPHNLVGTFGEGSRLGSRAVVAVQAKRAVGADR